MAIFGMGSKAPKPAKTDAKKAEKPKAGKSQADEAKAMLAKMEAKKQAGDCPFC